MADNNHLSNDEFFAKLTELFVDRKDKDHGSIFLTQKRLTYPSDPTSSATPMSLDAAPSNPLEPAVLSQRFPDLAPPPEPLPLIIRATNGHSAKRRASKIKLSTVVAPSALSGFYQRYAEICKAGMGALKPRDKAAKKKKDRERRRRGKGGAGGGSKE